MTRFCRECARFVCSPLATCRACGHKHSRDHMALEEPVPFRRAGQRAQRRRVNRFL